jgi:adenine-specific DNA-methyltransferase
MRANMANNTVILPAPNNPLVEARRGLPTGGFAEDHWKSDLGQFLTPQPIADFMASLFQIQPGDVRLLDAGAGAGALTAAVVHRLCADRPRPKRVSVTAYELDRRLIPELRKTLARCHRKCELTGITLSAVIHNADFIASAAPAIQGDFFAPQLLPFDLAIVNPPYRKIRSDSSTRLMLRSVGIETSNLYTGFLALIIRLLAPGGQLVSITPRSFCNGPYFRPFREDFLTAVGLRRLHLFESRSAAFRCDKVLQENVIVHAIKGAPMPEEVTISTSSGEPDGAVTQRILRSREIVNPDDPELFIHLPTDGRQDGARAAVSRFTAGLSDLGLSVSTGRVVHFRARESVRQQPAPHTVPLIYPCHFDGGYIQWPKPDARKPNAILSTDATRDLLVPAGVYVLVKRFTAKEEKRRVVGCIYDPKRVPADLVGFENHLNYFHAGGHGLPMRLAKGLAAFLNSTVTDQYFRQFSGHTQVNATDLRSLKYPAKEDLERLGGRVPDQPVSQQQLDALVAEELL